MVTLESKGKFKKSFVFLDRLLRVTQLTDLDKYGREGVRALSSATPTGSGETAKSWSYEIVRSKGTVSIIWRNSNVADEAPVAILIQYGHATRNGGWVEGIDFINPAMKPIFEKIAQNVYKEVSDL